MKKITILILSFMLLFTAASCAMPSKSPTVTPSPTPDAEWITPYALSKYTIVYPKSYTEEELQLVYFLRDAIKTVIGTTLPVMADDKAYSEYEIIFANSKRVTAIEHQVTQIAGPLDYIIALSENDVVIGGRTYYGDVRAVYDFVNNYVGYDDISDSRVTPTKTIGGITIEKYMTPAFTVNAVNYSDSPFMTAADINALVDAGFNCVTVDTSFYTKEQFRCLLEQCVRFGMSAVFRGMNYVEMYVHCPLIKGHCIVDEPYGENALSYYSNICAEYTDTYAKYGWSPFVNFMGQLESMTYVAEHPELFEYVDRVSFIGQSAMTGSAALVDLYRKYELFAVKARDEEKIFWGYASLNNIAKTDAEKLFYWLTNTAICFGANGIQYFGCGAGDGGTGLDLWKYAEAVNNTVHAMSDVYNQYVYSGTTLIGNGEAPEYTKLDKSEDVVCEILLDYDDVSENGQTYAVAHFNKQTYDNHLALYIMNTALPNETKYNEDEGDIIRLRLNAQGVNCYVDGECTYIEADGEGYFNLTIKNSQGMFLEILN